MKNAVQHVAMENLQKLDDILGKTRKSLAKERASPHFVERFYLL